MKESRVGEVSCKAHSDILVIVVEDWVLDLEVSPCKVLEIESHGIQVVPVEDVHQNVSGPVHYKGTSLDISHIGSIQVLL